MAVSVQKFREIVFQVLYIQDMTGRLDEELTAFLIEEFNVGRDTVEKAIARAGQVSAMREQLDAQIAETSESYAFDRIQSVERNILRLAVFELLCDSAIPPKVAISEAIRLGRKFSAPESGNFINAILDKLHKANNG